MSTLTVRASVDRWWTRQYMKFRLLYRSNRLASQTGALLIVDLMVIWFLPTPANLIVIVAEVVVLMIQHAADVQDNDRLNFLLQNQASVLASQDRQIKDLRAAADKMAQAADMVWWESRMLSTDKGRRERGY